MDRSTREGTVYEFGPLRLDPTRRTLSRAGEAVPLSPTLFDALLYLGEHPGRPVSKDELMEAVWPRRVVEDANVSQTIFMLRKALAAAGAGDRVILTQPGRGYRFAEPVKVVGRQAAPAELPSFPAPPQPARPEADRARSNRSAVRIAVIAGAVLLAAGAGAGLWWWRASHAPPRRSVVVLGEFRNLSREPLFDRTFTEAARIDLLQSPYLVVLPDARVQDTLALMTRSKDDSLTPAVAQEVCARNNGLASLDGSVAEAGGRYLLTLTATDCADGRVLAAEKAETGARDGLLPALDGLVDRLRRRLGESARSVRAFSVPILRARTTSFDALRAYSEGEYLFNHGKRIEAIAQFQHAIALDPQFAAAYADIAIIYNNIKEYNLASDAMSRAYTLRTSTDEHERFVILSRYDTIVTKDVDEGVRILKTWTGIFPNDATPWANLSNKETWIGQYAAAIEDGRRALALAPETEGPYVVLARALLHAGRIGEARTICDQAIAHRIDGDDLHGVLFEIASARRDTAAMDSEMRWAAGKPGERSILIEAGQAAFSQGQARRGLALFARALALGKDYGLGNYMAAPNARLLADMGMTDVARQNLDQVPAGFDSPDYRFTLAEMGEAQRAEALLGRDLAASPTDTLLTHVFAPEQRAALALRRGDPQTAIRALEPARPYERRTYDVPYLRGVAYLAAADGARAAAEFHKILDNPGVEAVSVHYPLARLGLARSLAQQHKLSASREAYRQFFDDWGHADPDMPLLRAARAEYAGLPPTP